MSEVEKALRSQRSVWKSISLEIEQKKLKKELPKARPRRILLFGVGSSLFTAKLTAWTLLRNGEKKTPIFAVPSIAIGTEIFPQKGDWVFGFSHRGKTPVTSVALEKCRKAGAWTVWVTGKNAHAHKSAHLGLSTSELEKCEPHTMGMTAAICSATNLLLGTQIHDDWHTLSEEADPSLDVLREKTDSGPTLIVGEWEGEWIAREARLKLIEMAGIRPIVFSTEEFFHGPQNYSQRKSELEKIWYVHAPGDDRGQSLPANDCISFDSGSALSWMHALVQCQWRALAVALNLGRNPDNGGLGGSEDAK